MAEQTCGCHGEPPVPVEDLMTRGVVTIDMDATLAEAAALLAKHGFHHLAVVESGRLRGVISDRDVLRHLSPFIGKITERTMDAFTQERRIHQVMSRALLTASPDQPAAEVGRAMLDRRVSCTPIIDNGYVVGIVTLRDICCWSLDKLGFPPQDADSQQAA